MAGPPGTGARSSYLLSLPRPVALALGLDVPLGVLVLDGHAGDELGLVGDELHGDPVPCLQVDMEAEVPQALVLLLAHVLVVGVAGGADPAPPPVRSPPRPCRLLEAALG